MLRIAIQERRDRLLPKQLECESICVRVLWSRSTVVYGVDSRDISDLAQVLALCSASVLIRTGDKLIEYSILNSHYFKFIPILCKCIILSYDMNKHISLPKGRIKLATVLQATGDIVCTDDVERSLNVDRSTASKLLFRWSR